MIVFGGGGERERKRGRESEECARKHVARERRRGRGPGSEAGRQGRPLEKEVPHISALEGNSTDRVWTVLRSAESPLGGAVSKKVFDKVCCSCVRLN